MEKTAINNNTKLKAPSNYDQTYPEQWKKKLIIKKSVHNKTLGLSKPSRRREHKKMSDGFFSIQCKNGLLKHVLIDLDMS